LIERFLFFLFASGLDAWTGGLIVVIAAAICRNWRRGKGKK
jgi:hypothetical protein